MGRLLGLRLGLAPPDRIFEPPAHNTEGVPNGNLHGIMPSTGTWIVIDVDIGAAFNRKPDAEPVWIAGEMFGPGLGHNNR
jgi:hypothetical protein